MTNIDLHVHTTASDGRLTPAELIRRAHEIGVEILSVADHDTIAGLPETFATAAALGVRMVPGVEFGIDIDGTEVHMLGYFFDPDDAELQAKLTELHASRVGRGRRIVDKLNALGVPLSWDRVQEIAGDGSVGRPHVARGLIEGGFVASHDEAFQRYLAHGRPAYEEHMKLAPEDCIALVHRAGGVALLAHPTWLADAEAVLPSLVAAGLDGIETYYGNYDEATIRWIEGLARKYHLVRSGGSDFHGLETSMHADLGSVSVPDECFAELEACAGRRQTAAGRR